MAKDTLKKQYRDLETKVFYLLREKINNSSIKSKHVYSKAIKVNISDYTELVIVDDRLTFLDIDSNHYSIFVECSLEDLIDILEK